MIEPNQKDNKMWVLAGEIALIFGLPAILAGIASTHFQKGGKILVLGVAFILSWIIFIFKYRNIIK